MNLGNQKVGLNILKKQSKEDLKISQIHNQYQLNDDYQQNVGQFQQKGILAKRKSEQGDFSLLNQKQSGFIENKFQGNQANLFNNPPQTDRNSYQNRLDKSLGGVNLRQLSQELTPKHNKNYSQANQQNSLQVQAQQNENTKQIYKNSQQRYQSDTSFKQQQTQHYFLHQQNQITNSDSVEKLKTFQRKQQLSSIISSNLNNKIYSSTENLSSSKLQPNQNNFNLTQTQKFVSQNLNNSNYNLNNSNNITSQNNQNILNNSQAQHHHQHQQQQPNFYQSSLTPKEKGVEFNFIEKLPKLNEFSLQQDSILKARKQNNSNKQILANSFDSQIKQGTKNLKLDLNPNNLNSARQKQTQNQLNSSNLNQNQNSFRQSNDQLNEFFYSQENGTNTFIQNKNSPNNQVPLTDEYQFQQQGINTKNNKQLLNPSKFRTQTTIALSQLYKSSTPKENNKIEFGNATPQSVQSKLDKKIALNPNTNTSQKSQIFNFNLNLSNTNNNNLSISKENPKINSQRYSNPPLENSAEKIKNLILGQNFQNQNLENTTDFIKSNLQVKITNDDEWNFKKMSYTYSYKSRAGQYSQNNQKSNQDSLFLVINFLGNANNVCLGVCDGHGEFGGQVSQFIKKQVPTNLNRIIRTEFNDNYQTVFEKCYNQVQTELQNSKINCQMSGSTCCTVLIYNQRLICGNIGDSRAIMLQLKNNRWQFEVLSEDHKPDLKREKQRITLAGGRVAKKLSPQGQEIGISRVWKKNEDIPGLAMTRSFGDQVGRQAGIISIPDVIDRELLECDKIIVLGSDGVFEFLSNQEIQDLVVPHFLTRDAKSAAISIVSQALQSWQKVDDISCIVFFIDQIQQSNQSKKNIKDLKN